MGTLVWSLFRLQWNHRAGIVVGWHKRSRDSWCIPNNEAFKIKCINDNMLRHSSKRGDFGDRQLPRLARSAEWARCQYDAVEETEAPTERFSHCRPVGYLNGPVETIITSKSGR